MIPTNLDFVTWMISFGWLLFVLMVWSGVWKGIALWKAGKNKQLAWFVCIFIFNTIGILPIIYLIWFQKKERSAQRRATTRKRRR